MNHQQIEMTAKVCHQVNKAYCESIGDFSQPNWEYAPDWQRQSAINGVKAHVDSGFTMKPEDSHTSWMKEKTDSGWVFGEIKDAEKKTHPCIMQYLQLPKEQRTKDFLFLEIVHAILKPN